MNNTGIKRNKAMRLASALLVLTLLTVCAISGTFAKYTGSITGSDKARVAYWGFTPSSLTLDLFSENYDNVDSSVDGENVVAPGTKQNQLVRFAYANGSSSLGSSSTISAPEVAYKLKIDAVDTDATDTATIATLDSDANFMWVVCPASKMDTTTGLPTSFDQTSATDYTYQTHAQMLAAIKAISGDVSGTKQYDPGKLPTGDAGEMFTGNGYYIGWVWLYDDSSASTPAQAKSSTDTTDTTAGNASALDKLVLKIDIGATQVD